MRLHIERRLRHAWRTDAPVSYKLKVTSYTLQGTSYKVQATVSGGREAGRMPRPDP